MYRTRFNQVRVAVVLTVALSGLSLQGCSGEADDAAPTDGEAATFAFRNALYEPADYPSYRGRTFELSHDYPTSPPGTCAPEVCTWLGLDVDFNSPTPADWQNGPWNDYIMAILDYVKQGQDPQLSNDAGFRSDVGGETMWYHVPWMAFDSTAAREFIHGTTNERTAHLSDFIGNGGDHRLPQMSEGCSERFPHGFETWAVGVYNAWGGYALGQSWPASGEPAIGTYQGTPVPAGLPFEQGTVVAKFLTTNAPPDCVPYLEGSPEWTVNRHARDASTGAYLCEREPQTSRLVQVDVAVVDERSPTRWVYGTFAYDGTIDADNVWDKLAPVGLQWGADPQTFPAVPRDQSQPIRQSVLNRDINIYEHFGCEGRLAGPVDNPQSSCMSCHASAYAAPGGVPSVMGQNAPPSFGFDGICTVYNEDNEDYFQNNVFPNPYAGDQYPNDLNLDTSLQMWVAFTQYGFFNTQGHAEQCTNPNQF